MQRTIAHIPVGLYNLKRYRSTGVISSVSLDKINKPGPDLDKQNKGKSTSAQLLIKVVLRLVDIDFCDKLADLCISQNRTQWKLSLGCRDRHATWHSRSSTVAADHHVFPSTLTSTDPDQLPLRSSSSCTGPDGEHDHQRSSFYIRLLWLIY